METSQSPQILIGGQAMEAYETAHKENPAVFPPYCPSCLEKNMVRITGYLVDEMRSEREAAIRFLLALTKTSYFFLFDKVFILLAPCAGHQGWRDGFFGCKKSTGPWDYDDDMFEYGRGYQIGMNNAKIKTAVIESTPVRKQNKKLEEFGL